MSQRTRKEVLSKLKRRYPKAGPEHKRKLLDQAQELLGYHRKAAIRALRAVETVRPPGNTGGRPWIYEPADLLPTLQPIWEAADYACGRRLVGMWPEWVPAYEEHQKSLGCEVRERLLGASARTLDRLLEPLRAQARRRSLTGPGTLLRHQLPISWQCVGTRSSRMAGSRYGGVVRGKHGRKEMKNGRLVRQYGEAQTPFARVLDSGAVTTKTKKRLQAEKAKLNPFALKREVSKRLRQIDAARQLRG